MGEKRQFRNSDWAKAALGKASIPQWFENGSSHVEVNDYPNDLREVEIRCASLENFPYDVAFIIAMWEPVGRFFWCRLTILCAIFVEMFFGCQKKTYPKQRSVSALFGGTSGVALRGPHGDASTHESLHHPDGGKVQKCHSRRWGSPV